MKNATFPASAFHLVDLRMAGFSRLLQAYKYQTLGSLLKQANGTPI
jgi:hypothetical protein